MCKSKIKGNLFLPPERDLWSPCIPKKLCPILENFLQLELKVQERRIFLQVAENESATIFQMACYRFNRWLDRCRHPHLGVKAT